MKRGLLLLLIVLCSICVVAEREGSTTLLAQGQNETGEYGTTAKLTLQLMPGEERVFLETFPLSKVTTQASLRFAQQIACAELDIDCRGYDFFWRIGGVNGIVGGPSAGAAASLLVSAVLLNETLPNDIAVTGTINSGGAIGPVAGLVNKITAASRKGIKTVYIAPGSTFGNQTNASELSKNLSISIVEAPTLGFILADIFGVQQELPVEDLFLDQEYKSRMRDIAAGLCDRAYSLMNQTNATTSKNLTAKAEEDLESGNSYSAASYCFRAAVGLRSKIYLRLDLSERTRRLEALDSQIIQAKQKLSNFSLDTITNLQTYMAVMERVDESDDMIESIVNLSDDQDAVKLAYAEERFHSALAWSAFFGLDGESITIDSSSIRHACVSKLEEAHERFNYVLTLISENLASAEKELEQADSYFNSENYVMCIYSASRAKALSNFMMDLIGTQADAVNDTALLKIEIADRAIRKSMSKGIFPIMAYSYLEYSKSLFDKEVLNSLLFSEQALELSNFEIYFKPPYVPNTPKSSPDSIVYFLLGLFIGGAVVYFAKSKNS